MKRVLLTELPSYAADSRDVNIIIETPCGSRNKFKYDPINDVIQYSKSLPEGAMFPHEFGFIPSTLAEDGDPVDALIFMDDPTYPGVLVKARLIGVLEAEQTEAGVTVRNDRLIAVASKCQDYQSVRSLEDLEQNVVTQIEHFFVSYNQMEGREFKPLGRADAEHAHELVEEGRRRFARAGSERRRD